MSDDKKEKIPVHKNQRKVQVSKIIKQLAELPAEKREELSGKLGIINPDGHQLTPRNQCLIYFQNIDEIKISVVAGYKQWQKFQRQVKKGEHGFLIAVPSQKNQKQDEENEQDVFFFYKTVFDISQTEELPVYN